MASLLPPSLSSDEDCHEESSDNDSDTEEISNDFEFGGILVC